MICIAKPLSIIGALTFFLMYYFKIHLEKSWERLGTLSEHWCYLFWVMLYLSKYICVLLSIILIFNNNIKSIFVAGAFGTVMTILVQLNALDENETKPRILIIIKCIFTVIVSDFTVPMLIAISIIQSGSSDVYLDIIVKHIVVMNLYSPNELLYETNFISDMWYLFLAIIIGITVFNWIAKRVINDGISKLIG